MNLYFIDKEAGQHLVARDIEEKDAATRALVDLRNRRPRFKSDYQRTWWDEYHRMWIDYGCYTEFYILQEEKYALNLVDDKSCNKDYCEI